MRTINASGWSQRAFPMPERWEAEYGPDIAPPDVYIHRDGRVAMIGREPVGADYDDPDLRWHISVRVGDPERDGRIPTWEELVDSAHALRPGVAFVVGIPPRSWWVNVHPHVLHLWETRDENLVASWRAEARGDRPT